MIVLTLGSTQIAGLLAVIADASAARNDPGGGTPDESALFVTVKWVVSAAGHDPAPAG